MNIQAIKALITDDMQAVDQAIFERLKSEVSLINQLGFYIVNNGGKRVRPMLVVLAAKALGCHSNAPTILAATVEFIHTATLLHDDVVDESSMRRGQATANARFGNAASVLTGDYLYSRAFQMMVEVEEMSVMAVLSEATNIIAQGEVMQLMNCRNPNLSVEDYYRTIYCKTAKLFEAGAQLGAIAAGQPAMEAPLAAYGKHLGNAFQLVDDVLDYTADASQLGKNLGDDLAEGKSTLPLIHAMGVSDAKDKAILKTAIENADGAQFEAVLAILKRYDSIEYTRNAATSEVDRALSALETLPESDYRNALRALALFTIERFA